MKQFAAFFRVTVSWSLWIMTSDDVVSSSFMALVSFQSVLPSLAKFTFSVGFFFFFFFSRLFLQLVCRPYGIWQCRLYGLCCSEVLGCFRPSLWFWPLHPITFSSVRPVVLLGAAWNYLRGCSRDGLVEAVGEFVDVRVVCLDCPAVFVNEAREHLPVSFLVVPCGKGLWVAGPVLQVCGSSGSFSRSILLAIWVFWIIQQKHIAGDLPTSTSFRLRSVSP